MRRVIVESPYAGSSRCGPTTSAVGGRADMPESHGNFAFDPKPTRALAGAS